MSDDDTVIGSTFEVASIQHMVTNSGTGYYRLTLVGLGGVFEGIRAFANIHSGGIRTERMVDAQEQADRVAAEDRSRIDAAISAVAREAGS